MNHNDAANYCASIDARLPLKKEFTQFREYMGAQPGTHKGYNHYYNKILPNLKHGMFWSSTVRPDVPDYARSFDGIEGYIFSGPRASDEGEVRCVAVSL